MQFSNTRYIYIYKRGGERQTSRVSLWTSIFFSMGRGGLKHDQIFLSKFRPCIFYIFRQKNVIFVKLNLFVVKLKNVEVLKSIRTGGGILLFFL